MRICLIYPQFRYPLVYDQEPLGILYIASSLREAGYNVSFVDLTFSNSLTELGERVKDADLIGIYSSTALFGKAKEVLSYIKEYSPDIPCVIGGPHATILPQEAIESGFEYAVIGEGDRIVVELVRALEKGKVDAVKGVAFRDNEGQIRVNEPLDFIQNLDNVPFPARDLLDYKRYHHLSIICSRGCPYNCNFCKPMGDKLFGKIFRHRSPENVVDEIERCVKDFGSRPFLFQDEDFSVLGVGWFEGFNEELEKRGLKIQWNCVSRVSHINYQLVNLMKRAGCKTIGFGVESGSQKVLNFYRKGITVEQSVKAFDLCHELGVTPSAFIMLGAPMETKEDLELTVNLVKRIQPGYINISITVPTPGTDLYDYAKAKGIFSLERYEHTERYGYFHKMPMKLEHLTQKDLRRYRQKMRRIVAGRELLKTITSWKRWRHSPLATTRLAANWARDYLASERIDAIAGSRLARKAVSFLPRRSG